ncbi:acylneuraminate cytidylyltransferase family protein [Tsuneonella sp. SYSU-LHT278]|uniref:acylneuraminate cytidylyltransferase family protein n=1 Tax=Tsuneonella sediminis TaxID=3416089 RepID=UPI003F78BF67
MPERVAVIPARAGSKGVPGKNKRLVAGKPLIAYSFASAMAARAIDRIIVTTDDAEIAALARAEGIEVVDRPARIAGDESPVVDAVNHALCQAQIADPAAVVLLQPTSPLRTGADIDAALALFEQTGTPVCSVVRVEDAHPARMYRIEEGRLVPEIPALASARRQDLPALYLRNGAIYIVGPQELARGEIICDPMVPYEMPADRSANVDAEIDLVVLEALLKAAP